MPGKLFGQFSDPVFVTTDADKKKTDVYQSQHDPLPSRYVGKGFKNPRLPSGKGADVYSDKKFLTLASPAQHPKGLSDEFLDEGVADRRRAKEAKKKNIGDRDWRIASVPKKGTGPGSFVGTFQDKPFEHKPEFHVQQRTEPSKPFDKKVARNIRTAPLRKGVCGVPGTLFSIPAPPKTHDIFDQSRIDERAAWEKSKAKMISTAVFRTTIRPRYAFDEKGTTGIPSAYDHYEPKEEKSKTRPKKPPVVTAAEKKLQERPVFKYANPPKRGQQGYISGFPNTLDDKAVSFLEKTEKEKEKSRKQRAKKLGKKGAAEPQPLAGPWKPCPGSKSAVCRSALRRFY